LRRQQQQQGQQQNQQLSRVWVPKLPAAPLNLQVSGASGASGQRRLVEGAGLSEASWRNPRLGLAVLPLVRAALGARQRQLVQGHEDSVARAASTGRAVPSAGLAAWIARVATMLSPLELACICGLSIKLL